MIFLFFLLLICVSMAIKKKCYENQEKKFYPASILFFVSRKKYFINIHRKNSQFVQNILKLYYVNKIFRKNVKSPYSILITGV